VIGNITWRPFAVGSSDNNRSHARLLEALFYLENSPTLSSHIYDQILKMDVEKRAKEIIAEQLGVDVEEVILITFLYTKLSSSLSNLLHLDHRREKFCTRLWGRFSEWGGAHHGSRKREY
jgi:hypothetical protein